MITFKTTTHVSAMLLSVALLHCSHTVTSEPVAPSPVPETVAGTTRQEPQEMKPASGTAEPSAQQAPQPLTPPPPAAPPPEAILDNEIFEVIDLANTAEIDQAKLAQTRAKSAKVKNFAAMMVNHHGKAKAKGTKLATKLGLQPADSPLADQLKADSEAMMTSLKNEPAADFDRAYMDGQVDAHQQVLTSLDEKLIVNARDPELKALLQEMRTIVESHLKEAQQIQASLAGAASPSR